MIREAIAMLIDGAHLTERHAETVMSEIMDGYATEAQIASYLTALRMKGETLSEVCGSVRAMQRRMVHIVVDDCQRIVDTCGTGGDGAQTFNISTTAAFVVSGTGITVAKHGNRAVSSQSGSADVLQQLGVCIDSSTRRCPGMHPRNWHWVSFCPDISHGDGKGRWSTQGTWYTYDL